MIRACYLRTYPTQGNNFMTLKTIDLALQGGGSHGALAWGVIDRLLDEPKLAITGISGTSAGAMNAAVLCGGLAGGSRADAQSVLHDFWKAISDAGRFSPVQRDLWTRLSGNWELDNSPHFLYFDQLTRLFSPYELNPLNLNPLKDLINNLIDFDSINSNSKVKVFICATHVKSGLPKIFLQPDINGDTLLASAALPFLFQAVEINNEAYWDGGYTGNPCLFPLVDLCDSRDLVLVQINPFQRNDIPKTARDIIDRLNEITFNNSLIKELRSVTLLSDLIRKENLAHDAYRDMRLHRIHQDEDLQALKASSKLNTEWEYLCHLKELGRLHADKWLSQHWGDLGERSSFDTAHLLQNAVKSIE